MDTHTNCNDLAGKDQSTDRDYERQSSFPVNHSYWVEKFDYEMPTSHFA